MKTRRRDVELTQLPSVLDIADLGEFCLFKRYRKRKQPANQAAGILPCPTSLACCRIAGSARCERGDGAFTPS